MANEQEADHRWTGWTTSLTAWTDMGLQHILCATEDRAEGRRIIHSAVDLRIEENWRQDKARQDKVFFRILFIFIIIGFLWVLFIIFSSVCYTKLSVFVCKICIVSYRITNISWASQCVFLYLKMRRFTNSRTIVNRRRNPANTTSKPTDFNRQRTYLLDSRLQHTINVEMFWR